MSRVLVVEDEAHLAQGLRFNLEAEGYEADVVGDGESATDRLLARNERFDVVVLDRTHCELQIVRSSLRLVFDRSLQRAQGQSSARSGLSIIPVRNRPDDAQAPLIFACGWHCPAHGMRVCEC